MSDGRGIHKEPAGLGHLQCEFFVTPDNGLRFVKRSICGGVNYVVVCLDAAQRSIMAGIDDLLKVSTTGDRYRAEAESRRTDRRRQSEWIATAGVRLPRRCSQA